MLYNDYYNKEKFHKTFDFVSSIDDSGIDPYYNVNENVQDKRYKLNRKGYLFFLLAKYSTFSSYESVFDYLNSHPYINSYNVSNRYKILNTELGSVNFALCVDGIKEAMMMTDDSKLVKVLYDVYYGKYAVKCHEISSILGINFDYIVTGFVNSPLKNYKYLHSFVVDGDMVFDFAKNLKMNKAAYYDLLNPNIVSEIRGNDFVDDLIYASSLNPLITPKEFLLNYDKLIKRK